MKLLYFLFADSLTHLIFSQIIWQDGWTPLHVAMQTRCRDIAKVLLINGADKTRRNKVVHVLVELAGYFVQYH